MHSSGAVRREKVDVCLSVYCERSEAILSHKQRLDCFVASLLATTVWTGCLKCESETRKALS